MQLCKECWCHLIVSHTFDRDVLTSWLVVMVEGGLLKIVSFVPVMKLRTTGVLLCRLKD